MAFVVGLEPYDPAQGDPTPRSLLLQHSGHPHSAFRLECQLYRLPGLECGACDPINPRRPCIVISWNSPRVAAGSSVLGGVDCLGRMEQSVLETCLDCLIDGRSCQKAGLILTGLDRGKSLPEDKRQMRSINQALGLSASFSVFTTVMQQNQDQTQAVAQGLVQQISSVPEFHPRKRQRIEGAHLDSGRNPDQTQSTLPQSGVDNPLLRGFAAFSDQGGRVPSLHSLGYQATAGFDLEDAALAHSLLQFTLLPSEVADQIGNQPLPQYPFPSTSHPAGPTRPSTSTSSTQLRLSHDEVDEEEMKSFGQLLRNSCNRHKAERQLAADKQRELRFALSKTEAERDAFKATVAKAEACLAQVKTLYDPQAIAQLAKSRDEARADVARMREERDQAVDHVKTANAFALLYKGERDKAIQEKGEVDQRWRSGRDMLAQALAERDAAVKGKAEAQAERDEAVLKSDQAAKDAIAKLLQADKEKEAAEKLAKSRLMESLEAKESLREETTRRVQVEQALVDWRKELLEFRAQLEDSKGRRS